MIRVRATGWGTPPLSILFLVLFAGGCSDAERAALADLALEGIELSPEFEPARHEYQAETGLLAHSIALRATAPPGVRVELRAAGGASAAEGVLGTTAALELGPNRLELVVGEGRRQATYAILVTRRSEPWQGVDVLRPPELRENGYFGDYLRASARHLYVNFARRGLVYERSPDGWVLATASEDLVSVELAWMYEAALAADTLAYVAEPEGGIETLFWFSLEEGGSWRYRGEHPTETQGTLRLFGDDLVFVSGDGITFLRREGASFRVAQTLPAPAAGIGFASRPTYFDSPGVALGDGVLVVGAPMDSSPTTGVHAAPTNDCPPGGLECAEASGAAFVYERDASGTWQLAAYLKAPDTAAGLGFGQAAAVDGSILAIGTALESSPSQGVLTRGAALFCSVESAGACRPESGAVYLYERTAAGWEPHSMLKASVSRAYDYFGDTLLASGDVLLVAAPGQDSAFGAGLEDTSSRDSGGVFAFLREDGSYRELGLHKLPESLAAPYPFPEAMQQAGFGLAVAASFAPETLPDGQVLENAGRVYLLR